MPRSHLQPVSDRVEFAGEEEKILQYWDKISAFQTSLANNADKPLFTFYDGPPFATGLPHYGHILAGTIKDVVTRYASQTGFYVSRRFGWDCFPESDTRVLTSSGFRFLAELEAAERAGYGLPLFACYDIASKRLLYRPGQLVIKAAKARVLVNLTSSDEQPRWSVDADKYGRVDSATDAPTNTHFSMRVTSSHKMHVQFGNQRSRGSTIEWARKNGDLVPYTTVHASELADLSSVARSTTHHRHLAVASHGVVGDPAAVHATLSQELGLHTQEAVDAFLELYGFWLGTGSLVFGDESGSRDAIAFTQCKKGDIDFLVDALQRIGLHRMVDYSVYAKPSNDTVAVQISAPLFVHYFHAEYAQKSSRATHDKPKHSDIDNRQALSTTALSQALATDPLTGEVSLSDEDTLQPHPFPLPVPTIPAALLTPHLPLTLTTPTSDATTSSVQSAKRFWHWVLSCCTANQLRLIIEGLRRADGDWVQDTRVIHTSCAAFRDELMIVLLHAGFSAHFQLGFPAGTVCGYVDQNQRVYSLREYDVLSEQQRASLSKLESRHDGWIVRYADDGVDARPAIARTDLVQEKYDGRVWCVTVDHSDHLIVAQRAHRSTSGVITKVSRPTIVSNCHGLPVEFEVDQKLGIKTKDDVLAMGVAAYNAECRSIVLRYVKEWETTVKRMGRWVDFRNDYKTMDTSFMESVWWVFGQLWQKGLVYRGYKVMPFSTGCHTPLSNFEAGQNYKDVKDPAVIVAFPLTTDPNTSILAWTTTPWTLPSNLALTVHPTMKYVKLKDKKTGQCYWIGKRRVEELYPSKKKGAAQPQGRARADEEKEEKQQRPAQPPPAAVDEPLPSTDDYDVLEQRTGNELLGLTYTPLFPYFASWPGGFRVIPGDYVTEESGTGIVHSSPGFGEDDYTVCLAAGVIRKGEVVVCPVDDNGCYTAEVTDFKGRYVKDADKDIMRWLKEKGRLIKQGQVDHPYPYCWRSETPLLYKAVPSWFVHVEKIKEELLAANAQTYWVPAFVKEKRFHNWLRDARDWAISRSRFWGTPLPLWVSDDGEEVICISSIEELEKRSGVTGVTDLHKDKIDHITIPSERGKGQLKRSPDVFDCWFESGSMPYAQQHYPFENKDMFERGFPADFIAEGLDQTRGWFYTLMVISTALFNKPAFKNLIVNGLVLAADGRKMSKRLKNYPDPTEVVHRYGADALRIYLINSPVVRAEPLRFVEDGVKDVVKTVLLPWFHAYRFFVENAQRYESVFDVAFEANVDGSSGATKVVNVMDRWIMSSFQSLIGYVRTEMAAYRLYTVTPRLLSFIDSLTNWYVRLNRRRLKGREQTDTHTALSVLFYILFGLCKLMAPFTPFFVESLYQNLKTVAPDAERSASIHYLDIPAEQPQWKDERIERVVSRMQRVVELGRTARNNRLLTMKQPLQSLLVIHQDESWLADVRELEVYVRDEMNVREVRFSSEQDKYIRLVPVGRREILGKKYGRDWPTLAPLITAITADDIKRLTRDGQLTIQAEGKQWLVERSEVEVQWQFVGGVDEESVHGDDVVVVLDVRESAELREEGVVREVMREVQKMRKKAGLVPSDAVEIYYEWKVSEEEKVAPSASAAVPAKKVTAQPPEAAAAEEVKEEKKADGKADGKVDGKGKKDSAKPKKEKPTKPDATAAAAPASKPSLPPINLDTAIQHQSALLQTTLNAPLRPLSMRPAVSSLLLASTFQLDCWQVLVQLVRPSVHVKEEAVAGWDERQREGVRQWLGCRERESLTRELKEGGGVLRVKLDGQALELKEGVHFDLQ